MNVPNLAGRTILVVEDEPILAFDIADEIERHNGAAICAATLQAAERELSVAKLDACLLDIRLGNGTSYSFADQLIALGIPFFFASSESRQSIPPRFAAVPLHRKPARIGMVEAIAELFHPKADT